jgi:TPR repeat protein
MGCKHCEGLINGEPSELAAGFAAYRQYDYTTAFQLLLPYAEAGHITAECLIGSMHQLGLGAPQSGLEAAKWYERASQQGCGVSYNNLATIYLGTTPDVPADPEKAQECWRKAVENGFEMAGGLLRDGTPGTNTS